MSYCRAAAAASLFMMFGCKSGADADRPTAPPTPTEPTTEPTTEPPTELPTEPTTEPLKGAMTEKPTENHSLTPASDLLAWFEDNAERDGKRTLFRAPVVIVFGDALRHGAREAFIGTSIETPGDKLSLVLDDSSLGIGLSDRLDQKCEPDATWCAVWLDGYWGPLIKSGTPSEHTLAVRAVGDLIDKPLPTPASRSPTSSALSSSATFSLTEGKRSLLLTEESVIMKELSFAALFVITGGCAIVGDEGGGTDGSTYALIEANGPTTAFVIGEQRSGAPWRGVGWSENRLLVANHHGANGAG